MLQRVMKLSLRAQNEPHCFHWPASLALCNQYFAHFLYVTVESRNLNPWFLRSVMGGGELREFGEDCLGFYGTIIITVTSYSNHQHLSKGHNHTHLSRQVV